MYSFTELKKNLKKDYNSFRKVRLAILGDTSTQILAQALKGYAFHYQIHLDIYEADFNQIERQVFDASSDLYAFKPEITIVFNAVEKLLYKFNKCNPQGKMHFAEGHLQGISAMYEVLEEQLGCKVIYYNFCEIDNAVFGNYANKTTSSFIYQLRKINLELMRLAQYAGNFYVCDLCTLQNRIGRNNVFAANIYINTDMVFSLDFIPHVAKSTLDIITALQGKAHKCLILDLDNTLWGGVIGDDGIENVHIGNLGIGKAFTEFQLWLKALKERGIILAVCSKNTESVAKEVFQSHPDMVLRLHDIAVFVANWENKVDNIRYIQSVLNIGYDSMVFVDDNPFERNMVRNNIPDITVPEMPEDPADYLSFLYSQNLFETASFSVEDENRTTYYQTESKRVSAQKAHTDEGAFLESLDMTSDVQHFNKFNTPRVAQLSQRSNQFNLRTIRYTEADIERMGADNSFYTFTFTLEDKFGDNGLICVVILKKEDSTTLFIDSWFMSCRVLKRSMEEFVLNTIVSFAAENGFRSLKGEYIATAKNELVKDHYKNLGFQQKEGFWILAIDSYNAKGSYIKNKNVPVNNG